MRRAAAAASFVLFAAWCAGLVLLSSNAQGQARTASSDRCFNKACSVTSLASTGAVSGTTGTFTSTVSADAGVYRTNVIADAGIFSNVIATGDVAGATGSFSGTITSTAGSGTSALTLATGARIYNATYGYCGFQSGTQAFQCNAKLYIADQAVTFWGGDVLISGKAGGSQLQLDNDTYIINPKSGVYPVVVNDADGLLLTPKSSLPTCSSSLEGDGMVIARSGATKTKVCRCTLDGSGNGVWYSETGGGAGDATTCPATP